MPERHYLDYKRILVVDDEQDVIDTLKELLKMCEVIGAVSFLEAKELLKNQYFDIAILDIMGVDGYALLNLAKERGVIALMLTAHALSPENIARSFKEGAASYIPKDEIANITTYLNDILEAAEQGKHFWWRWIDRLGGYFDRRFGPNWQKNERELWEKFNKLDT